MADGERLARVERLLEAARTIADHERPEGRSLRQRLRETTGLSQQGIALGIARSLETNPSTNELYELLEATPAASAAHVLLSSNVFVAPLRAIAIALASSARVFVRASRREPTLAEGLHALEPTLFELVSDLEPQPGEHFWAYGSDETLDEVSARLPRGVWFHGHGHGIGAVVVEPSGGDLSAITHAIALDAIVFDQQGCLSPRVVCVQAGEYEAVRVAQLLARRLEELELEIPLGPQNPAQRAAARAKGDSVRYAFQTFDAGSGWVSVGEGAAVVDVARTLHVVHTASATQTLAPLARHITCLGCHVAESTALELRRAFPGARIAPLGEMQRPPLDGPVDRRHRTQGELLS